MTPTITLMIAATAFLYSASATTAPPVTFLSPCECQGFHGKNRWVAKTDLSLVPADKSAIQSVTPSQIYAWEGLGPDVELTRYTEERMAHRGCRAATLWPEKKSLLFCHGIYRR